jgi:hypothetical protein
MVKHKTKVTCYYNHDHSFCTWCIYCPIHYHGIRGLFSVYGMRYAHADALCACGNVLRTFGTRQCAARTT